MSAESNSILDTIQMKGSLVQQLILDNPNVCPEFKTTIIKGSMLGSGNYGVVNNVDISKNPKLQKNISFPGLSNTNYVIKTIMSDDISNIELIRPMTVNDAINYVIQTQYPNLIFEIQLAYNGGDKDKIVKFIKIVKSAKDCLISNSIEFIKNDGSVDVIEVDADNYICSNNVYSEYMIGVLCSSLSEYLNNSRGFGCRNFVFVTDFATCTSNNKFLQYVFMEKIDRDLDYIMTHGYDDIYTPSILFQCFFAIYTYEFMYQMNHNDLHFGNIFIRILPNIKYLCYKFKQNTYYIPTKYLVKIGDYGLSCKYSEPMILNKEIMDNEITDVIPNFYNTCYDVMCLLLSMVDYSKYIKNLLNHELGDISQFPIQQDYPRPKLDRLDFFEQVNADNLLSNHFSQFILDPQDIPQDDIIYMGRML